MLKKIAGLRVFKKNFETQRQVGAETKKFGHPSEVVNYSWRLFKDKFDQNVILLAD